MPNPDNLKPAKPGEIRNPAGRPVGSKNRSTIARRWLQTEERFKNPITVQQENLTEEDIMTLALIKKARSGEVNAYKALMDSAYGAPTQNLEHTGLDGGPIQTDSRRTWYVVQHNNGQPVPEPDEE